MQVTTLNNLKEFLNMMKMKFAPKTLAAVHRKVLNTHILNVDYADLDNYAASSKLSVGKFGTMILGNDS